MDLRNTEYVRQVGDTHRKAHGQFFTHPKVAQFMVNWILEFGATSIHDPAFGLGVFHKVVANRANVNFTGSEIDPTILCFWKQLEQSNQVVVAEEDYLLSWGKRFENIICNPPYMRFQRFLKRNQVFNEFERHFNFRLSGYTNTASAFLLKSLFELYPSGKLAYIMPLEFLNTGYGTIVKEKLIADRHLAAIIKLDCEKEVFPDATTSVGIILYDASNSFPDVRFFNVKSLESLNNVLESEPSSIVPCRHIDPRDKWLPYLQEERVSISENEFVMLGHYGRFCRGIATGANEFFVLKSSRVRDLGLSYSDISRCITKSSQIRSAVFTEENFASLKDHDEPVFLFNANGKKKPSKNASMYIRLGEERGFNKRFLTKNRKPWYKTENRIPSPLLLGVFSRGGYKVIRNQTIALNLTCFHGFQPNLLGLQYVDRLFLYLMSSAGRKIVSLSIRKYGDALDKFEPNDLNTALVPGPSYLDGFSDREIDETLQQIRSDGFLPDRIEARFSDLVP